WAAAGDERSTSRATIPRNLMGNLRNSNRARYTCQTKAFEGRLPLTLPLRGRTKRRLLLRRHGAQIGDHGVEVFRRHLGIERVAHRRLELAAVARDALGNGALDLLVAPGAQALLLVPGDVARHRNAPRTLHLEAARARAGEIPSLRTHRRVALHAMSDGDEIEAALELVAEL